MPSDVSHSVTLRLATPADAAALSAFAAHAFEVTFGPDNDPRDMELYMSTAFGESIQRAELEAANQLVVLAEVDGAIAGYVMLRFDAPHEGVDERTITGVDAPAGASTVLPVEIARLYAGPEFIGAGIGSRLMERALSLAVARGARLVWLGVWDRNARAIAFYRRWQFVDVGSHPFMLGRDLQVDRVMARRTGAAGVEG